MRCSTDYWCHPQTTYSSLYFLMIWLILLNRIWMFICCCNLTSPVLIFSQFCKVRKNVRTVLLTSTTVVTVGRQEFKEQSRCNLLESGSVQFPVALCKARHCLQFINYKNRTERHRQVSVPNNMDSVLSKKGWAHCQSCSRFSPNW